MSKSQVVSIIFLLTVVFALLIWYGMYDNPIDSVKLAQVSPISHIHDSQLQLLGVLVSEQSVDGSRNI